jgi:hypothetical protein
MRVPVSQSQVPADGLKRARADVTLKIVPGAGHGGPAFQTATVCLLFAAVLAWQLGSQTGDEA